MITWLTGTTVGKFIVTFFISMVPVVELRLGLPYGIALGLPYFTALTAAVLGNMLPVPFIIIYIKRIFAWLRRHWAALDGFITRLERRAEGKGEAVEKYGTLGLLILVAIPLGGGAFESEGPQGLPGDLRRRLHRGRHHDRRHLRCHQNLLRIIILSMEMCSGFFSFHETFLAFYSLYN